MIRSIASNVLTFLIIALAAASGVIFWGQRTFVAQGPLEQAICLRVAPGDSMGAVAQRLEAQDAVSHATLFRVGANYSGRSGDLKFGNYLVAAGSSMDEIIDVVTRGGQSTCGAEVNFRVGVTAISAVARELNPVTGRYEEVASYDPAAEEIAIPAAFTELVNSDAIPRYRVTLAEGVTSWQVRDALQRVDILDGEIADVPAEGSLSPDSYEVQPGDTRASVIERMQVAQENVLAAAWAERADDLPVDSPEELLILASLIEKETGVAAERAQVASVFVNRLRQGIRLQTDPAVIYGVTNGEGVLGRGLRRSELDTPTPYNTYTIDALPPTPIANPGRNAIAAAANPDETPYIFFVADGTGGHAFAVTLREHNANVARWREIEARRNQ